MKITKDIQYVGVNDERIDLFEGQYSVPHGISYNSYVILDEKIAVMDSVGEDFFSQWRENLQGALKGRAPDYLVVHHMEPDHSANVARFLEAYPDAKVVSSAKAFAMMKNFFGTDFPDRQVVIKEGDTLSLGEHRLSFVAAPMVHWPEVMMSYDSKDKVLFSADAFGKFSVPQTEEPWEDQARRYYIGIVGKYGMQVQAVLKKAAALDLEIICPLHGPTLKGEEIPRAVSLYHTWSSYQPEEEGVVIAYTSVYGNTKKAVECLAEELKKRGVGTVLEYDLARCDTFQAVADAFRFPKLVLATTTYNMDVFPYMRSFIDHLTQRGYCNRTVALIENGSWAPAAEKVMRQMLEKSKNLQILPNSVRILSALNEESRRQLTELADSLALKEA